jgi:hypothetical protein
MMLLFAKLNHKIDFLGHSPKTVNITLAPDLLLELLFDLVVVEGEDGAVLL